MAVSASDWLVADSEEEDEFPQLHPVHAPGASPTNPSVALPVDNLVSPEVIQTATFTSHELRTPQRGRQSQSTSVIGSLFTPPPGGMDSTIDDFTSVAPTSVAPSEMPPPPRPRPRPRVVIKRPAISDLNTVPSAASSHISCPSVSTTKRACDDIQSATPTSFAASEVVDDIYSSFGIADRAKMRSRKSQKAKESMPSSNKMNEVIELTSDEEDELILKPTKRQKAQSKPVSTPSVSVKPRPKPRLKVKRTAVLQGDSPPSEIVRQHPQVPLAQDMSSQFPPSTLPTVPPSTPPQAREPTPLSPSPIVVRKRKRIGPSAAVDDDEMNIVGSDSVGASLSFAEPPPFFAPSSSSVPTDSGVEIPPVESLGARGKKKQGSSKKGAREKTQNNRKKGRQGGMTSPTVEAVEEPASASQEATAQALCHRSNLTNDSRSPIAKQSTTTKTASEKKSVTRKGKSRVIDSDQEDGFAQPSKLDTLDAPPESEGRISKENLRASYCSPPKRHSPERTPASGFHVRGLAAKPKPTPMSELIRRVNSQPNSPFHNATRTYSPLLKSSRTMLSKIAPLHPNRRTPPPPPPRPPPPKKSKKQLEMEERIEEELAETIEGWACLTDDERKALRKMKIDAELGYE